MGALLKVELTRLRWRRAVVLLLAAAVLVPAVVVGATAWGTRPLSEADLASAESDFGGRFLRQEVRSCGRTPEFYGLEDVAAAELPEACRLAVVSSYVGRSPLSLSDSLESGAMLVVAAVLVLLLVLLGTTFVGHDWNTGSMSNQLLFEARRGRVWAAKALAVGAVGLVVALLVSLACWLALMAIASSRDLSAADGVLLDGVEQCLRTGLVAAGAAFGGYALTMLLRSTVATLGVVFALTVLGGTLIGVLGGQETQRWEPQLNVMAAVTNEVTYYDDSGLEPACLTGMARPRLDCDATQRIGAVQGGSYVGVVLLALGAASVVSFRRRDVP